MAQGTGPTTDPSWLLQTNQVLGEHEFWYDSRNPNKSSAVLAAIRSTYLGDGMTDKADMDLYVSNGSSKDTLALKLGLTENTFKNVTKYNTHPIFNADTQLVDKKYVDESAPIFSDDFLGNQRIEWVSDAIVGTTSYPNNIINGVVRDETDAVTNATQSYNFGGKYYFHENSQPSMEVRLQLGGLTNSRANVGLISSSGHYIKINYSSDVNPFWIIRIYNGVNEYGINCGTASIDMTTIKFTWSDPGTLSGYRDGVYMNSTGVVGSTTSEFLQPFRSIESLDSLGTKFYDIDYIKIYQNRI